jgi:hypothetical protein
VQTQGRVEGVTTRKGLDVNSLQSNSPVSKNVVGDDDFVNRLPRILKETKRALHVTNTLSFLGQLPTECNHGSTSVNLLFAGLDDCRP